MVMKSVKLASILFYLNSVFVVSCFVSCGSSPTEASSLLTADIRGGTVSYTHLTLPTIA